MTVKLSNPKYHCMSIVAVKEGQLVPKFLLRAFTVQVVISTTVAPSLEQVAVLKQIVAHAFDQTVLIPADGISQDQRWAMVVGAVSGIARIHQFPSTSWEAIARELATRLRCSPLNLKGDLQVDLRVNDDVEYCATLAEKRVLPPQPAATEPEPEPEPASKDNDVDNDLGEAEEVEA